MPIVPFWDPGKQCTTRSDTAEQGLIPRRGGGYSNFNPLHRLTLFCGDQNFEFFYCFWFGLFQLFFWVYTRTHICCYFVGYAILAGIFRCHISVPIIHYSCHIIEAKGEVGSLANRSKPPPSPVTTFGVLSFKSTAT